MRYLPSAFIGQLAGTMGCTTATHSRYSSFFRNRVMPINPRTPAQSVVRDLMTSLTQNWRGLSATEQLAWQQLAQLAPRRNIQGKEIILTGHAFYVHLNLIRNTVNLARVDVAPPAVEVPPSFTSTNNTVNGTGAAMTVEPIIIDGSGTSFFTFWATPFLSPGVSYVSPSDYRLLGFVASDPIGATNILSAYEDVFGAGWQTMQGMNLGIKLQGISDSGFEGQTIETLQLIV